MKKTPWHLWLVGIVALLWDLMGAYDYLMTEMRNEAYMSRFTPEQLEFFYGFPTWIIAAWALAVWGGVLGSVLLLLRRRLAVPVFLVSLLAMVVTSVRNYGFADGLAASGTGGLVFSAVIFLFALFLLLYSRAMASRGLLR